MSTESTTQPENLKTGESASEVVLEHPLTQLYTAYDSLTQQYRQEIQKGDPQHAQNAANTVLTHIQHLEVIDGAGVHWKITFDVGNNVQYWTRASSQTKWAVASPETFVNKNVKYVGFNQTITAQKEPETGLIEALGYIGAGFMALFGFVGFASAWEDLSYTGQALILVVGGLIIFGASEAPNRKIPALGRLSDVLGIVGAAMIGGGAGVAVGGSGIETLWAFVLGGVVGTGIVSRVYYRHKSILSQLSLGLGIISTSVLVTFAAELPQIEYAGYTIFALGVLWYLAAGSNIIKPPEFGVNAGSATIIIASVALLYGDVNVIALLVIIAVTAMLIMFAMRGTYPIASWVAAAFSGFLVIVKLWTLVDSSALRIAASGITIGAILVIIAIFLARKAGLLGQKNY